MELNLISNIHVDCRETSRGLISIWHTLDSNLCSGPYGTTITRKQLVYVVNGYVYLGHGRCIYVIPWIYGDGENLFQLGKVGNVNSLLFQFEIISCKCYVGYSLHRCRQMEELESYNYCWLCVIIYCQNLVYLPQTWLLWKSPICFVVLNHIYVTYFHSVWPTHC